MLDAIQAMLAWEFLPWSVLGILATGWLLGQAGNRVANDPIQKFKENFAMVDWPHSVALLIILIWGGLFVVMLLGLGAAIIDFSFSTDKPTNSEQISNFGFLVTRVAALTAILGALVALPFTALRLKETRKQNETAQEGLITDRINKAVEGLGAEKIVRRPAMDRNGRPISKKHSVTRNNRNSGVSFATFGTSHEKKEPDEEQISTNEPIYEEVTVPNLEVRIGAIYSLERISKDSPRDHIQIMEILCAYIRENSKAHLPFFGIELKQRRKPRVDIQTAISVLGRRAISQRIMEESAKFRLDLRFCNLDGVDFSDTDFKAAIFANSRFEGAIFQRSNLEGANFFGALLNYADWFEADLTGAIFDNCILNLPEPKNGTFGSSFEIAKTIKGVSFAGADLTAVDYLGEPEQSNETFGTSDTKLHYDLDKKRHNLKTLQKDLRVSKRKKSNDAAEKEKELKETGFAHWSPFESTNLSTNMLRRELKEILGLTNWPHR